MTILQYASAMEVLQFLLACVGLGLAMWGVWVAFEDAVDLTATPPEDLRRLIALRNMRERLAEISAQGVLVFVGVVSVLLPPPSNPASTDIIPELEQAFLVRLGLMFVTAILTANSFMERKQRRYFMNRVAAGSVVSPLPQTQPPMKEVTLLVAAKESDRTPPPPPPSVSQDE